MQLSSEFVGMRSHAIEVALDARRTMNYAAGIDDSNPAYFDDEREGGVLAPPMLSVALTWPISGDLQTHWDPGAFPVEVMLRQVHYTEHIEWSRPMVPGDRLCIEGEITGILPHRAGTHFIVTYQATDARGSLVFTERIGAFLRGVKCPDEGRGVCPELPLPETNGDPLWSAALPVDLLAAHRYDACADIHFPIHSSPAFAHQVGLPRPIYQGTATLSLAVREITNREAGGDPRLLRGVACNFSGMLFPGDEITVRLLAREGQTCYFDVLNTKGKAVIRRASLRLGADDDERNG